MALRSQLRSIPVIGPIAARGIDRYRTWRTDPGRRLRAVVGSLDEISVVQIGASDGERQDPIRRLLLERPRWRALLVEPDPPSFSRLRANYPVDERFVLDNVAVAATDGTLPFWYLDEGAREAVPGLPGHFDQLGSFDEHYLTDELGASRTEAIAPYLRSIDVPTLTFESLLVRHAVDRVDLLIVDTNGSDWVVLRQVDLDRFRPSVVLFEHKHLSPEDLAAARAFLGSAYTITDLGDDLLCRRR
jgi:FkbM family methyltransferase